MEFALSYLLSPKIGHFIAVYEKQNLRTAAESIGISQPALTKSIKSLELQIETALFNRSSKGMQPTPAGDALFTHVKNIAELSRGAELTLSSLRGVGKGLIRIGAGQMWSRLFISNIASAFRIKFPSISLEIETGAMPELVEQLTEGALDIVIGDFDGLHIPQKFITQYVWSPKFMAFAPADHPLADKENVHIADLVLYPWSGYLDRDVFTKKIATLCATHRLRPPDISIKATSMATLLQLTRDSGNIVVLPQEMTSEAAQANLVPIQSNLETLWTIKTGSIIDARKITAPQYQELLKLIKDVGIKPTV